MCPDIRVQGVNSYHRGRAQRAAADRGAEIVVYLGVPESLPPPGTAGRGVRVEPIAGELLGALLAAPAAANPGGLGGDARTPAEPVRSPGRQQTRGGRTDHRWDGPPPAAPAKPGKTGFALQWLCCIKI